MKISTPSGLTPASAAARGAERLDRRRPNWFLDIDLPTLDLDDPHRCVLGQLYDRYSIVAISTCLWPTAWLHPETVQRYGFASPPPPPRARQRPWRWWGRWNRELTAAWKREIQVRRKAAAK